MITLDQALAEYRSGRLESAAALCSQLLHSDPNHAATLHVSGLIALSSGNPQRAVLLISRAIEQNPGDPITYANRGLARTALRQYDSACADFELALARNPALIPAWLGRGVALTRLGRLAEALASYDHLLRLDPSHLQALFSRGVVLQRLNRLEEALQCYNAAIALSPRFADAYTNRGTVERYLGLCEAALASYDQALALVPEDIELLCNRAMLLLDLQQVAGAVAGFDKALALQPDLARAHYLRGCSYLLAGNFQSGWPEMEWRWRDDGQPVSRDCRGFVQPPWLGQQSLRGVDILLHAEQGFGDVLQFCRYVPLVADLGAHVILEAPGPLIGLLHSLRGVATLVTRGEPLPKFETHCPLMSLPLAFGTTLESIPAQVPYLHPTERQLQYWRERLRGFRRLRVGLVWSGGDRSHLPELQFVNRRRNLPLQALAPLRGVDADFFSLQKGEPACSELAQAVAAGWTGPSIHDFTADLEDFAATAALVSSLDLVISVDTSVAHLAGAIGAPVWLLNRSGTCWRWMLGREDSPWYPTMRIYRQARSGDWAEVIERVRSDLCARLPCFES